MYPLEFAVNQTFPSLSSTSPCGPDPGVGGRNSLICPVFVSTRPNTFAYCPVYHRYPSLVASGSCGRDPIVGAVHSLKLTVAGPGIITAFGTLPSGKLFVRYSVTMAT